MGWRYTREAILLRVAPWADISVMREKLIDLCLTNAPRYKNSIGQFSRGRRSTLPNLVVMKGTLRTIIMDQINEKNIRDGRIYRAYNELERYFFDKDYWREAEGLDGAGSYIEQEMA